MTERRQSIRRHLLDLLAKSAPRIPDSPPDDLNLMGDLGLESVQILELVRRIETSFGLILELEQMHDVTTLGALVRFIEAELQRQHPQDSGSSTNA